MRSPHDCITGTDAFLFHGDRLEKVRQKRTAHTHTQSHSSTELRGRTHTHTAPTQHTPNVPHTHSTDPTHTKRPTHTELTHSGAGNALPVHTSGLAYKYRQGGWYVVMTAVFPGCFTHTHAPARLTRERDVTQTLSVVLTTLSTAHTHTHQPNSQAISERFPNDFRTDNLNQGSTKNIALKASRIMMVIL